MFPTNIKSKKKEEEKIVKILIIKKQMLYQADNVWLMGRKSFFCYYLFCFRLFLFSFLVLLFAFNQAFGYGKIDVEMKHTDRPFARSQNITLKWPNHLPKPEINRKISDPDLPETSLSKAPAIHWVKKTSGTSFSDAHTLGHVMSSQTPALFGVA